MPVGVVESCPGNPPDACRLARTYRIPEESRLSELNDTPEQETREDAYGHEILSVVPPELRRRLTVSKNPIPVSEAAPKNERLTVPPVEGLTRMRRDVSDVRSTSVCACAPFIAKTAINRAHSTTRLMPNICCISKLSAACGWKYWSKFIFQTKPTTHLRSRRKNNLAPRNGFNVHEYANSHTRRDFGALDVAEPKKTENGISYYYLRAS
jgi:hypothetical protein